MTRIRTRTCKYRITGDNGVLARPEGIATTEYMADNNFGRGWKELFHWKLDPKGHRVAMPTLYGLSVNITGFSYSDYVIPYVPYLTHISQSIVAPKFDFQTNNKLDIGQTILEFKDTLTLFTKKVITDLNSIGSGVLAWEFGYKQVISDVSSLIASYYDLRCNIVAEINANSGLRKNAKFTKSGSDFAVTWGSPTAERIEFEMDYKVTFLGSITYNFPTIEEVPLAALLDEFGVPKNPLKLAWAVFKFSWLVDWITNSIIPKMIDHLMPMLSGTFYNPSVTFNGWTIYKCKLKVKTFNADGVGGLCSEGKYFRRLKGSFSPGNPPKPTFNFLPDDAQSFDSLIAMIGTLSDSIITGSAISKIKNSRLNKRR
jgi:hypothetical protein